MSWTTLAWIRFSRLSRDTRGQDLIEYALMAGMISLACVVIVPTILPALSAAMSKVSSALVNTP